MPENATRTKPRIDCNIAAQLEAKKAEHDAANRPASWFQLKLAVGLVFAIFGYALYVFLVRILLPMVRLEEGRRGSRTTGIVLLVFWCLLWLMFVWTYLRVILTKPGFAVDYIEKTARPEAEPWDGSEARSFDSRLAGPAYDATTSAHDHPETAKAPSMTQVDPTPLAAEHSIPLQPTSANERHPVDQVAEDEPSRGAIGPQLGSLLPSSSQPPASDAASSQPPASFDPAPESSTAQLQGEQAPPLRRSNASRCSAVQFPEPPDGYSVRSEYLNAERKPPQHAVLTEAYRWCTRCEIVKPYRAHHCRHCGTCVLKMDHHCPWVGTCVGARNYKYFYNFLQWSSVFTVYLFIVSLVVAIPQSGQSVDGHQIALVIIAGVFALFTSGLALTHTHMMLRNMTTIEQMGIARMKQRETMAAQRAVGCFNYPATRRLQKRWDREWGGLNTEGNLWWLGSSGDNWRMVMGDNKLAWFLPIPTSSGDDGLSYTPNPRFSPEGRWRRREEWPAELR